MNKTKAPFTANQRGIGEILKTHKLKVPANQREYSWTEKEVKKLFQDLAKAISDGEEGYFLGTIVTIPDNAGGLEVIDGQQRLATITILLCNIRRYLIDKDKIIADDIINFLTYTDRGQRTILNRLKMNNVDNDFFCKIISDDSINNPPEATRRSHKLILESFDIARRHVNNIISGFDLKDHGDILNKWVTFIEHSAEVILLEVPSGANAYKMFETLNDRGLKTTQADLVKNYLFGEAGDTRLAEAQECWISIRGALESLQEDEKEDLTVGFMRHALMVTRGFLRKDNVYEIVQQNAKGEQQSIAFLKTMENLVRIYVATFYRDHEKWNTYPDAMRNAIQTLNFFNIQPIRPVLLSIATKFIPKEASKAYELFISISVRLLVYSRTTSSNIEETLAAISNKIYSGEITNTEDLKRSISNIIPTNEQFKQAFELISITKHALARYYLRTLERAVTKRPNPHFILNEDKEAITLEHILPEKPGNNWPQFSDEEVTSYWKRLGNMVLLQQKDNSNLKSAPFSDKKTTYEKCPYELTVQVTTVPNWTVETIKERQSGLAKLAVKAWSF